MGGTGPSFKISGSPYILRLLLILDDLVVYIISGVETSNDVELLRLDVSDRSSRYFLSPVPDQGPQVVVTHSQLSLKVT